MSTLFDDLEENLRKTYHASQKESFSDIALDDEERDKIISQVSGALSSDLNVDYSKFKNHIFFGSAYAAANFALARVIRDYPLAGELKDKTNWRKTNTGYENWFFDNYPKHQGYLYVTSGSMAVPGAWAAANDYEGKLGLSSGTVLNSFTIEGIFRLDPSGSYTNNELFPIISITNGAANFSNFGAIVVGVSIDSGQKNLAGNITYNGNSDALTASIDHVFSQSNHFALTYDKDTSRISFYLNGELCATNTLWDQVTGSVAYSKISVGAAELSQDVLSIYPRMHFSGDIDEIRVWNQIRSPELIKKNYNRTIHANASGGLKLYYKFNEPVEYGNHIIDYSGNEIHGFLTGNFSIQENLKSGTLGGWFKDVGDPIFALNNPRVDSFVIEQRNSGSKYDDENQNMIFNLVPSVFVEGEDAEFQQLFLLLTARHFDRLKLYIEHLSNITKQQVTKYDGPPANLLDLAAKHYGFDIGGIYSSVEPLQDFFGENIYASGVLESSIEVIRNTLKRNILSNLSYILKSKGTQEAIKSTLRAIGLNDNIVSINEYTDFSGGVQTTFSPKTVERKVASFLTSSNIFITSSAGLNNSTKAEIYQVRFLMNPSSQYLTQSIMSLRHEFSNQYGFNVAIERENISSSNGIVKFSNQTTNSTSSLVELWNNNWVNLTWHYDRDTNFVNYYISSIDRNGLIFETSGSHSSTPNNTPGPVILGRSGSVPFDGYMQEFRAWKTNNSNTWSSWDKRARRWAYDWELTEVDDLIIGYRELVVHAKLDDFDSSISSSGTIHDYVSAGTGSYYVGFSENPHEKFPGKYIDKFDVSYTYDLNVDNDKIRIKEGSVFTSNDENYDIPFVSIDFSPITALNKEIMKWMGNLERIVQIASDPIYQYRDTNTHLDALRTAFFREKINNRIDYRAFANLIKWFDGNFTHLLSQLMPLDMGYSISNYVIEPHILEYNKVKKYVGVGSSGELHNLEASISTLPRLTASSIGHELDLADPGRYGAFVSASANVSEDIYLTYTSSSNGLNYNNLLIRKVVNNILAANAENKTPEGFGNGFYLQSIEDKSYLKHTLNVKEDFEVNGIPYVGAGGSVPEWYLTSSNRFVGNRAFTGSIPGIQDARWLWIYKSAPGWYPQGPSKLKPYETIVDFGLGYGGGYGQLYGRNNKSFNGRPLTGSSTIKGYENKPNINMYNDIEIFNENELKTYIFWPLNFGYEGVVLNVDGNQPIRFEDNTLAEGFGNIIPIEGYDTLNIEILGRTNPVTNSDFIFGAEIKFQFFSEETPGDFGYETVFTSALFGGSGISGGTPNTGVSGVFSGTSNTGLKYMLLPLPVEYFLRTETLPKDVPVSFSLNFERPLPRQRFMRIWMKPHIINGKAQGGLKILCKANISKKSPIGATLKTIDE